ncbi:hypothetical protein cyc_01642 [Cyclospora cayetanensis]|uniref:Uncharacterized protein n=1 Tax=Cyclospora cayetanensis TaxID=88456 RepID=A0A1D3D231_9EIME|nr:hypothetical protein cyc_01642 [Cyclospora cayetanensis]
MTAFRLIVLSLSAPTREAQEANQLPAGVEGISPLPNFLLSDYSNCRLVSGSLDVSALRCASKNAAEEALGSLKGSFKPRDVRTAGPRGAKPSLAAMDAELALVSALQLREMLQQYSPRSSQVQELAAECEKHLADIKRVAGRNAEFEDARMQQSVATESLDVPEIGVASSNSAGVLEVTWRASTSCLHQVTLLPPGTAESVACAGKPSGTLSFVLAVKIADALSSTEAEIAAAEKSFDASTAAATQSATSWGGAAVVEMPTAPSHGLSLAGKLKDTVDGANLATPSEVARNETALLHQQNCILQQQLQQASLQQQQQLHAFQTQLPQTAIQFLLALEVALRFKNTTAKAWTGIQGVGMPKLIGGRDRLQEQVLELETALKNTEEEKRQQRQQVHKYRQEAARLQEALEEHQEMQQKAEEKQREQEMTIAELTTLLANAREPSPAFLLFSSSRSYHQSGEGPKGGAASNSAIGGGREKTAVEPDMGIVSSLSAPPPLVPLAAPSDAPPRYTSLPGSPRERYKQQQPPESQQRRQHERGQEIAAAHAEVSSESALSSSQRRERDRTCLTVAFNCAMPPLAWSDTRVLRRVIPAFEAAAGDEGERQMLLQLQEGYVNLLQQDIRIDGQPWSGRLLDSGYMRDCALPPSGFLKGEEWVHSAAKHPYLISFPLESRLRLCCVSNDRYCRVAAIATFSIFIVSKASAAPSITASLMKEVLEGGRIVLRAPRKDRPESVQVDGELELSRPYRDIPVLVLNILEGSGGIRAVAQKERGDTGRSSTNRKQAACKLELSRVVLDLLPERIRSAVSLCSLGGRLFVLPMEETGPLRALQVDRPGVMTVHASCAFPVACSPVRAEDSCGLQPPSAARWHADAPEGDIECFVELSARRNASVETELQMHSALQAGRQPCAILRVRCSDCALKSSLLEVLLQQLVTPQQLLDAAAAAR